MGGEGHMLDMIRRLKDGKEASRLRRERRNDKLGRLRRNNDPYLLPEKITAISYGERLSLWAY